MGVVNRHRKAAATFFRYLESDREVPELPVDVLQGDTLDVVLNPPEG